MIWTSVFFSALPFVPLQNQGTELTVYNANFGLVKEVREINLSSGRQTVRIEDVAAYIDPTSVSLKSLTKDEIEILEQNYQYDLISPQVILLKSIGKRIRVRQVLENGQERVTEGVLLSAPGQIVTAEGSPYQMYSGLVMQTDDGRIILNPVGTFEVLELPEGLISKPTLMWDLIAGRSGAHKIELAYLTNQINWYANYVLTLNADDTKADLNGWVTINNQSGKTYKDANLKLVAGDVRRLRQYGFGIGGARAAEERMAKAELGFAEEQLFEYHLYTLQRPATVRDKETKQIALLSATEVPVKKDLVFEGQKSIWISYGRNYRPGEGWATDTSAKVNIVVEVHNSEKNKLGMPLPKGIVRVYKRDSEGRVQMLGEDEIAHTPREEKFRLYIGDAFDIVGSRTRTNFQRISDRVVQETFEIKLRNRKKTQETVRVVEHGWGDWQILNESMPSKKIDSNTFEYLVTLKPDVEAVIRYTIQTRW
ncbi:MAG TPA: DUF4139 domain-containing protein [Fimbriimonadales bacterium]|nr:DUF4139 domain-containing protein [Fimbriimonadales bacterium]